VIAEIPDLASEISPDFADAERDGLFAHVILRESSRHNNRHKRDALRKPQKGKGQCAKGLGHIGQQASGEGGIRTRGGVLPPRRFSKAVLSATQPPLQILSFQDFTSILLSLSFFHYTLDYTRSTATMK
jgi:hypothetical protein